MIRSRGLGRPPFPVLMNRDSPEANGLLAWFPIQLGASVVRDFFLPSTEITLVNAAKVVPSEWGWGLDSFSANDTGARVTTPTYLTTLAPVTMMSTFVKVGTSSNNSCIFEISHSNADASPFIAYGIGFNGSAQLRGEYNTGVFVGFDTTIVPDNFVLHQVMFALQNAEQKLYYDGTLAGGGGGLWGGSAISGTSQLCIGINETNLGRNPNIITLDCRIYNRFITPAEAAEMWNNGSPWGLYATNTITRAYRLPFAPVAAITTPEIMAALSTTMNLPAPRRQPKQAEAY